MKTGQRLAAFFAAAFILSGSVPVWAAQTDRAPADTAVRQENDEAQDEHTERQGALPDIATLSANAAGTGAAKDTTTGTPQQLTTDGMDKQPKDETGCPVPDEAPLFRAHLEYRMGYTMIGSFTEFTPDIIQVQTLYSLDGENWQDSNNDWNLYGLDNLDSLDDDDKNRLGGLYNQPCLFDGQEPLKSYVAGTTDRFYVKLRITKQNGHSYDTQPAVIERGGLQPVPKGTERTAWFSSGLAVHEAAPDSPDGYVGYGKYQLTVSADATAKEVAALLPDTFPVTVYLELEPNSPAIGTVDCPVVWKPLSLPRFTAGESITIADAAEEISVPAGAVVSTPLGIFRLEEPLPLDLPPTTDEVRLVLNVSPENKAPTGVLRENRNGLEIAFHLKPTGATAIRAYVLAEGEEKWAELSGLSLLEEMNQPSTANSGYGLVLKSDQEPYRSYLEAINEGRTPTPFFIGLQIEGGIYGGQHLILSWPDIYEELPHLPKFGGAGGNEGNAGADNRGDSTEAGQRPDLPQISDDRQNEPQTTPGAGDGGQAQQNNPAAGGGGQAQQNNPAAGGGGLAQQNNPAAGGGGLAQQNGPGTDDSGQEGQQAAPVQDGGGQKRQMSDGPSAYRPASDHPSDRREEQPSGQRPNLPQIRQHTSPERFARYFITAPDADAPSDAHQAEDLTPAPLVVYAAEADMENEENLPPLSDEKAAGRDGAGPDRRNIPFLPFTTTAAAGCCIGAAACKAAGSGRLCGIAGKIRMLLHLHI